MTERSWSRLGGLALLGLIMAAPPPGARATPAIQHWQTANGARVYFVPAPELPMIDIRVVFDAGSARDAGKGGLALLTNALLTDGAGALNADAIAERFDDVGAIVGNGADRDTASVSLRSLSDPGKFDPALDVLASILRSPRFDQADLDRERNNMIVGIEAEQQSPAAVAQKAFFRAVYGDHPYGAPPDGSAQSLRAIRRSDVMAFYRRYYVARNAVVAIVGAVTRSGAERIARRLVGGLPSGEVAPPLPPVSPLTRSQTIRINFPSEQTHILMGQPGMRRGDLDYFALFVANQVLGGGGLVSRLAEEIREKRGLAYSAYSFFAPLRRAGPFEVGLQTRNSKAREALDVMRATVRRYRATGPTADELTAVKKNLTGGFPLRIDNNHKIVGYLGMIGFYRLPLDYLDRFNARIQGLTRERVTQAFRRRIDLDHMVTVIVGPNHGAP